jgi:hypothetical protein
MAETSPLMCSVKEDSVEKGTMLLSAMVGGSGGCEEEGAGEMEFPQLKVCHVERRRSLEDEGRHMRKGRGGGALIGSANLVGRPNQYGPR